jgi:hypothetical protein
MMKKIVYILCCISFIAIQGSSCIDACDDEYAFEDYHSSLSLRRNGNATGSSSGSKLESCEYDGIPLHGKVQFVESFADFKIEYVESFPDLKVKFVTSFPDECGEWEVVESFPDFKVEVVESFADIKVEVVESFPGLP